MTTKKKHKLPRRAQRRIEKELKALKRALDQEAQTVLAQQAGVANRATMVNTDPSLQGIPSE